MKTTFYAPSATRGRALVSVIVALSLAAATLALDLAGVRFNALAFAVLTVVGLFALAALDFFQSRNIQR